LVAALLAAGAGFMAFMTPATSDAAMTKEQRRQVMLRTVFIMALQKNKAGDLEPFARGSGTIITPDGAVLTNHHVVWNEERNAPADAIIIGITVGFEKEPEMRCIAFPSDGVLNAKMDLALVKCQRDMQSKPWQGENWPTINVGSSEDLVPGDDISVIGYPGIGGYTINYTTGKVSGFVGANGESAGRDWVKTDADIASGNSGGTAVDEDGNLIGVPSAVRSGKSSAQGRVGLIRPVEHARDLINLAKSGWEPGQQAEGSGGDGGFGTPQQKQPPPPPQVEGVVVQSQVKRADNGQPISGATFVVLRPGVRVQDIQEDKLEQQVLTFGRTNAQGRFQTEKAVPKGQKYSVIVVADGFEPLHQDGVLRVDGSAQSPFDPWGEIRLRRK
jgi:S1-C subfamily serine protease